MAGVLLLDRVLEEGVGVPLKVDRVDLWKRRWRGVAEDGTEVAVDLEKSVSHGALLYGQGRLFSVIQNPEDVVVIRMPEEASMAAKIGWYLGNRHLPIEVRSHEILLELFPTLTDSLERIGIAYELRRDVLNCRPHSEHTH